jgi:hypothetical protein
MRGCGSRIGPQVRHLACGERTAGIRRASGGCSSVAFSGCWISGSPVWSLSLEAEAAIARCAKKLFAPTSTAYWESGRGGAPKVSCIHNCPRARTTLIRSSRSHGAALNGPAISRTHAVAIYGLVVKCGASDRMADTAGRTAFRRGRQPHRPFEHRDSTWRGCGVIARRHPVAVGVVVDLAGLDYEPTSAETPEVDDVSPLPHSRAAPRNRAEARLARISEPEHDMGSKVAVAVQDQPPPHAASVPESSPDAPAPAHVVPVAAGLVIGELSRSLKAAGRPSEGLPLSSSGRFRRGA